MSSSLSGLINILGYEFGNSELLVEALTHRSVGAKNYERLEFLGDSILNFVIADQLFTRYPQYPEGDLSRLRASLVNKDSLAKIAKILNLGEYLILGSGELKSGGFRRDSILADTVEALIGAVYVDGGFELSRELVLHLYEELLGDVPDPATLKDPKTRLQELLQSRKLSLPVYEVTDISGKAHSQTFVVTCSINELDIESHGKANSRRKAEQKAAIEAIAAAELKINLSNK
ncbi:MAG: ribonuclease III [Gammaproteobacteria bacterium]|nr:ribonuclease III [Gammaproteobacteria bacterium]MDH5734955.1 ribonuclease III [Gammaproteobacteria bacterium]